MNPLNHISVLSLVSGKRAADIGKIMLRTGEMTIEQYNHMVNCEPNENARLEYINKISQSEEPETWKCEACLNEVTEHHINIYGVCGDCWSEMSNPKKQSFINATKEFEHE